MLVKNDLQLDFQKINYLQILNLAKFYTNYLNQANILIFFNSANFLKTFALIKFYNIAKFCN